MKKKNLNKRSFKAGDVVVLKSGGPKMTILEIYDDGTCECGWVVIGPEIFNKIEVPLAGIVLIG